MIQQVPIKRIKPNTKNPRVIKDSKFRQLVQSIKEFPEMLQLRPIVVNDEWVVLGGNQRLKACKEAGLEEVPVIHASDLTPAQQQEFIVKDNVSAGEWDWKELSAWENIPFEDWGLSKIDLTHSGFTPELLPPTSYDVVSAATIRKEAERLAKQMVKNMPMQEVICPNCEYEFDIERK
jgi:hypothetical protein